MTKTKKTASLNTKVVCLKPSRKKKRMLKSYDMIDSDRPISELCPQYIFIRSRKLVIEIYPLVYAQNQKMAYFQRQKTQCGTMSIFFNIDSSESSYYILSWFQMSMSTYSSYIVNYALTFGSF